MDEKFKNMEMIFSPRSVAFVGASNNTGKWGGIIFRNMVMGGYEGASHPVNPKEESILDLKVYKSVLDIPGEVDLAIFTIPAAAMPDAISECVKKKVKAGVVVTAGFAELGAEGLALQDEMVKRAKKGGMVLVGPNGQGIASPYSKLYPWMPILKPLPGSIGIASQSGNVSTVFCEELAEFGFGISKAVSAGNCAYLGFEDYLDYFRQDPKTMVVLLYVEGVCSGRGFFEAAKRCALEKPVVLLKSGRTSEGSRAASTHTGVLAGSDDVFGAACRQAGIVRADTIEDAVMLAAAFVNSPLPAGRRLGMITGGGGFGVIAADACARMGLSLPALSEKTVAKLREHLPAWWSPNNPVDMVAGLGFGGPRELLPVLMDSGEVDGVILLGIGWIYSMMDEAHSRFDFSRIENAAIKKRIDDDVLYCGTMLEFTRKWGKPFLMTSSVARLAVRHDYPGLMKLVENGVMLYPAIEDAVRAMAALAERGEFLRNNS